MAGSRPGAKAGPNPAASPSVPQLDIRFKIVTVPEGFTWPSRLAAFTAAENPGFLNKFGPVRAASPTASRLNPTPFFFQGLNRLLRAEGYEGRAISRLPATIRLRDGQEVTCNVNVRAVAPGCLSVTLALGPMQMKSGVMDPTTLMKWQDVYNLDFIGIMLRRRSA